MFPKVKQSCSLQDPRMKISRSAVNPDNIALMSPTASVENRKTRSGPDSSQVTHEYVSTSIRPPTVVPLHVPPPQPRSTAPVQSRCPTSGVLVGVDVRVGVGVLVNVYTGVSVGVLVNHVPVGVGVAVPSTA